MNGRQILRSTRTADRALAEQELARVRTMFEAHKARLPIVEELARMLQNKTTTAESLTTALRAWIEDCEGEGSAPNTLKKYRQTARDFAVHLHATEEKPLLPDLRPEDARTYLATKRKTLAAATVRTERKVLATFAQWCVDTQRIASTFVLRDRSGTRGKARSVRARQSSRRAFTLDEIALLHRTAPTDFWRYMILAGYMTGQRMGDLITLAWPSVDWSEGVIRIVQRKTGASVQIPMHQALHRLLLTMWGRAGEHARQGYVWPAEAQHYEAHGAGPFSNAFYDQILAPAGLVPVRVNKQSAGKGRGAKRLVNAVGYHSLRHSFISTLKLKGSSQLVAKELAGHKGDAISDLYSHAGIEALTSAIVKLPDVTTQGKDNP